MKNIKTLPQKSLLISSNQVSNHSQSAVTTTTIEKTNNTKKVEQPNKLIRRYSFDDNGGSYFGL